MIKYVHCVLAAIAVTVFAVCDSPKKADMPKEGADKAVLGAAVKETSAKETVVAVDKKDSLSAAANLQPGAEVKSGGKMEGESKAQVVPQKTAEEIIARYDTVHIELTEILQQKSNVTDEVTEGAKGRKKNLLNKMDNSLKGEGANE